jgi:hypothetical protein
MTIPSPTHDILGLAGLSEDERTVFLAEIGSVIIESALLNFVPSLSDDEQAGFAEFLNTAGEGEALIEALLEHYPTFADFLGEAVEEFRAEAQAVLGSEDPNHDKETEYERSGVHHE